jgi:outer membrane protein
MNGFYFHIAAPLIVTALLCGAVGARADTDKAMTLQESIAIALSRNASVHAAEEGVKAAEARKKAAFTGFLPRLSTAYSYTYLHTPPYIKGLGLPPPVPGEITSGTRDNYNWAVEARQPLFTGGGILADYQINRIETEVSRQDRAATIQDVILEVTVSYFNILKAQKIREVAAQSLAQLEAHRDVAKNFFDVGLIPKNDLLTAEVQAANGRQALLRAENEVELAKSRFNTVLRRDVDTPVEVADVLAYRPFRREQADSQKKALAGRPEIKAFSLKVQQADKRIDLARSEFFPSLSMIGNYSRFGDGPDLAGSQYQDRENWYLMGVLNWTFWEWGKTRYRVEAVKNNRNQARDALIAVQDGVSLEVKNALLNLEEAEKRILVAQMTIEQAEENFRITRERYNEHVAASTDVIDAQTLLTRAKSDYFNALSDYHIAGATLERSTGVIGADFIK